MYYFKVDETIVARLGEATDIAVRVLEVARTVLSRRCSPPRSKPTLRLKDFAAR